MGVSDHDGPYIIYGLILISFLTYLHMYNPVGTYSNTTSSLNEIIERVSRKELLWQRIQETLRIKGIWKKKQGIRFWMNVFS